MNREDIIRMAREAGFDYSGAELSWESVICTEELERFAALIVSAVREQDRENALAYMRMLHDSFSLASDPSGLKRKV